jgi:hypothetical protein
MATGANYRCTQPELYTVAETGWNSLEEKLPDFTNFKPKYDAQFIADRRAELAAAEALPDEQARYADVEVAEVTMKEKAKIARAKWQMLKRYIIDAFPSSNHKARLEEAGSDYYEGASAENWDSVKELMKSGSQFINNHIVELTANNNMPAGFQLIFDTAKGEFNTIFTSFLTKTELAVVATQTKTTANNLVYDKLINMMDDGKEIFKEDEAVRKQFVFDEVLALIKLTISDSAGYETEDYEIEAGASLIVGQNTPDPTEEIYAKIIKGNNSVIICTTDESTPACTSGYTLEKGTAFKGQFSELGLNPALPKLRITNPGTEKVIIRGGPKKESE